MRYLPYVANREYFMLCIIYLGINFSCFCQTKERKEEIIVYKEIGNISLEMKIVYPENHDSSFNRPALLFYSQGGWVHSDMTQFVPFANYFAGKGMVCFLVKYREINKNASKVEELIEDVKASVRFVRKHAKKYNINQNKVVLVGASAGGQLVQAAHFVKDTTDNEQDAKSVSASPNAMVLLSANIDMGPSKMRLYRSLAGGELYKKLSPIHNLNVGAPPRIMFLAENDPFLPKASIAYYALVMKNIKSRLDIHTYEGDNHEFYMPDQNKGNFNDVLEKIDAFLVSLGLHSK